MFLPLVSWRTNISFDLQNSRLSHVGIRTILRKQASRAGSYGKTLLCWQDPSSKPVALVSGPNDCDGLCPLRESALSPSDGDFRRVKPTGGKFLGDAVSFLQGGHGRAA